MYRITRNSVCIGLIKLCMYRITRDCMYWISETLYV